MALEEPASTLLDLPDPCLVAVLRCCANDQRCLCSAARAHSRLHQAAVLALRSITAVKATQQQAHSMLQYLEKHGQHLDSISISTASASMVMGIAHLPSRCPATCS
jgi:hypothetical protein